MKKKQHQKYACDRCGFDYRKIKLRKQMGMLLCDPCFDATLEIPPFDAKFSSPRTNATSITAVTSPTVFTITSAGITAVTQSTVYLQDGPRSDFLMHIVGSTAPTDVTANPQIVAGTDGDLLSLKGTSDTYSVTLSDGRGLSLPEAIQLNNNVILNLVYNASSAVWQETSRGYTV